MPIPVRTRSPGKVPHPDEKAGAAPATTRIPRTAVGYSTGEAPTTTKQPLAKEPTRLPKTPVAFRAAQTASTSRQPPSSDLNVPRPGPAPANPRTNTGGRVATSAGDQSAPDPHKRTQSWTSSTNGPRRPQIRPPGTGERSTESSRGTSGHASSTKDSTTSGAVSFKSHGRTLSESTRQGARSLGGSHQPTQTTAASRSARDVLASSASAKPSTTSRKPGPKLPQQIHGPKEATTSSGTVSRGTVVARPVLSAVTTDREVVNLQAELLQLALLRKKSEANIHTYEERIRYRLKARFDEWKAGIGTLRSLQRDRQAAVNAVAVRKLLAEARRPEGLGRGEGDTLLVLAHCLNELLDVSREAGPLDTAMEAFERWQIHAASRKQPGQVDDKQGGKFQTCLDPQWSALVASIEERVKACEGSLAGLRTRPDSSSISMLIRMHTLLAEHVLQEIRMCRALEALTAQEEQEWIDKSIQKALFIATQHSSDPIGARHELARKGIWELGTVRSNG